MSATLTTMPNTAVLGYNLKHDLIKNNRSFDEIDNKTQETTFASYPVVPRPLVMHVEGERLKTFDRWPLDFIERRVLAQTGMYYTGEDDRVKCYFCNVEIGRWEPIDHPVQEHMKWSPNCPLLRRRTVNNVPISAEALDRALPPVSYDVCGSVNEPTETRPAAFAEDSITSPGRSPPFYQMEYPAYAVEGARFRSFTDWPRTMKQKPKDLAEAGFFYTGNGDRVNCFSCGGGLKDWDENDDPWEQHALWLKNCRYLKLMKGKEYIDAITAKYKLAAEKSEEAPKLNYENCCQTKNATATTSTVTSESVVAATATASAATRPETPTPATATKISGGAAAAEGGVLFQRSNSSSSTERGNIPEDKLCKICYAAEYNTTFLPCGHVVACARCASSVNRCPMCRKPFLDVMRVYFS